METQTIQNKKPQIVVPLTGVSADEIIEECNAAVNQDCDVLEWRADYYMNSLMSEGYTLDDIISRAELQKILKKIRSAARKRPVIFTVRTKHQCGRVDLPYPQYRDILKTVVISGFASYIDLEYTYKDGNSHIDILKKVINTAHRWRKKVIISHHNFENTPEVEEMVETVRNMSCLGADISKLAVMSHSREDTTKLMEATAKLSGSNIIPIIMIAMGEQGRASRVAAGRYGSCMTFASAINSSAPGQLKIQELRYWMNRYYDR